MDIPEHQWDAWLHNVRSRIPENPDEGWRRVKEDLKSLQQCDDAVRSLGCKVKDIAVNPNILPYILVSGSMAEGSTTARWFQDDEHALEIEIDVMYNAITIPADVEDHLVMDTSKSPMGYTWIFSDPAYTKYCSEKVKSKIRLKESIYIDPMHLKNKGSKFFRFQDNNNICQTALSMIYGVKPSDIIIEHSISQTATTDELKVTAKKGNDVVLRFSCDHVPCIKLMKIPDANSEWLQRKRKWPSDDVIQEIASSGIHLVPKTSPNGDISKEWRLSFSEAEIYLSTIRSENKKIAYLLFKILFYKYLKPIKSTESESGLFSYLCKTVMIWSCEEYPVDDPVWESLQDSLDLLLGKLITHLENKHLSNYFVKEINLLEKISENVLTQAVDKVKLIRHQPLAFVPFDLPTKTKEADRLASKLQMIVNFGNMVTSLFGCSFHKYFGRL